MTVPADLVIPAAGSAELAEIASWDGVRPATYARADFPVDVIRLHGSSSPPIFLSRARRAEDLKALPASLRSRAEAALGRFGSHPVSLKLPRDRSLDLRDGPIVMGVVNVTPDSFSDGGLHLDPEAAVARGLAMFEEGAAIVDVGGESTRPATYDGPVREITAEEEIDRIAPVIAGLRRATDRPISIDTRRSAVARRALELGAELVNDVSALRHDGEMAELVGSAGAGLLLMHMKGEDPRTMQNDVSYRHPIADVAEALAAAAERALAAGVAREAIVLDPGLGFGKSPEGNLVLLRHLAALRSLGFPLAVGASRKGFVRRFSGVSETSSAADRLPGSLAAAAAAAQGGAAIVRVHDVAETVRFLRMHRAIRFAAPALAAAAAAR
ncbi:MAG: dihydropteroate synthase [Thermoanaerobaculia bacterium]